MRPPILSSYSRNTEDQESGVDRSEGLVCGSPYQDRSVRYARGLFNASDVTLHLGSSNKPTIGSRILHNEDATWAL